jgi:ribosome-binding protein aMBF1 (putative translation factor)
MMTPDEMDRQRQQFGQLVKAARTRMRKLSQKELAERVGCDGATIDSIEKGESECDYPTILRVCAELKIPKDAAIIFDPDVLF